MRVLTVKKEFTSQQRTEGNQLFQATVLDNVKDCVIATDLEGTITYWNQGADKIFGYSNSEMSGASITKISLHDKREIDAANYHAYLQKKTLVSCEWEGAHKNGSPVYLLFTYIPLRDNNGRISGLLQIGKDITEHKKAEKALHATEGKLSEQNLLLEQKNVALQELINQNRVEKERIEKQVQANVDHLLKPVVEKLKGKGSQLAKQYTSLLEANLNEITSRFGNDISSKMLRLTQKEIDVCNMIKNGFSSKQISEAMNISTRTVETHRNSIRKKLSLSGKDVNLATYLKYLQ